MACKLTKETSHTSAVEWFWEELIFIKNSIPREEQSDAILKAKTRALKIEKANNKKNDK